MTTFTVIIAVSLIGAVAVAAIIATLIERGTFARSQGGHGPRPPAGPKPPDPPADPGDWTDDTLATLRGDGERVPSPDTLTRELGPYRFRPDALAIMAEPYYPVVGEPLEPLPPHAAPDVAQAGTLEPASFRPESWIHGPEVQDSLEPVPFTAQLPELDAELAARWDRAYPLEAFRRDLLTWPLDQMDELFVPAEERELVAA